MSKNHKNSLLETDKSLQMFCVPESRPPVLRRRISTLESFVTECSMWEDRDRRGRSGKPRRGATRDESGLIFPGYDSRIHCFENVTAIIFLVAISEYDQMLYEDGQ